MISNVNKKLNALCLVSFLAFPLAVWAPPGDDDLEALKAKNIKQTELVADLREAILQVARHFQCVDPKNCSIVSGNGWVCTAVCSRHEHWVSTTGCSHASGA